MPRAKRTDVQRQRVRRPLPKTPEEMKAWSFTLSEEISSWPEVVVRPMFGMMAFYRGARVFACLPHKRAFDPPNTVSFKLDPFRPELAERARKDPRISGDRALKKQAGWLSFEIRSADDLREALWWFNQAHRAAALKKRDHR